MTHHHHLAELAAVGAVAFGAYELYHFNKYGNFGIGNPYNHGISFGGFGGAGAPYGYGNPTFGHHHHIL